jgi:hypothetical protein
MFELETARLVDRKTGERLLVKSARTAVLGSQKAGRNLARSDRAAEGGGGALFLVLEREAELRGPPRDHSIETLFL